MTLFRTLDEQLDVQTAGGKGYHLSCLASLKMPVPEALILDAASYSAWSAQIGSNDDESLKLDPDSALQLSKWLASFPPATRFAVRSSANLEDLGSAACAGQHDSVLNVKPENIPEAIVACYRSLKNDRAVAYRRQHGFDEESATMAVVIQRMIPAEVSGVAFAVNPVSGRLNETLIEANFGLGETVVGGEHATDTWLVKDGELISERRIGNKERVMLAAENGTRLIELPPGRAAMPCLSDAQILEIARISRQLMQKLQQPQDVEWVIQDDRLYLVQARPQTTLPARFTRHEAAERFPNPITPLTWSCVDAAFSESLEFSLHMMSIDLPTRPWFALRDHYVYGNQNAVELLAMKRPVRATTLQELEAEIPGLMRTFHWVSELPSLWQSNLDQFLLSLGALSSEIVDEYEIDQFRDYFARIQQAAVTYFRPNIAISMTQAFLVRTLEGVMILSTGDRSRARMLVQKLLSAASLKTGLVNRELQKLASRIQSSPSVKKVFDGGVPKLESLRSLDQDFYDALLEFINRHGHREVDFDFIHPTWGDDPEPVLAILGKLAESDNRTTGDSPQQAWQLRQQVLSSVPESLRSFLGTLVDLALRYTELDDAEHYHTTRLNPLIRRAALQFGRRLDLDEPADCFFLTLEEINAMSSLSLTDEQQLLIRKRKQDWLKAALREPPICFGPEEEEVNEEGDLSGIPGSPGTVEGEVYLVNGPQDFAGMPDSAILVARTTNPAWTPLFYSARGLITQFGGPLSHGAVTAREIGIPAVMSVAGCLQKLKNGMRVRLSGDRGHVTLCEE